MKYILSSIDKNVAVITLNRPNALNAMCVQMIEELTDALKAADSNPEVHVIVMNSACERAFTAGGDIKEESALTETTAEDFALLGKKCMRTIYFSRAPVIIAIEGYALGGAIEMVASADITVASDKSILGVPTIELGGVTAFGATKTITDKVGRSRSCDILLTGRKFSAGEALDMGLIEYVVPAGTAFAKAMEIASLIASKSPVAIKNFKKAILGGIGATYEEGMTVETECFVDCYRSEERAKAMETFLNRKKK